MENVYTQHTPLFAEVLDPLLKGRLRDTTYPFIDPPMQSGTATPPNPANNPANQRYVLTFIASLAVALYFIWRRPQDVVVFTVGGTTYEEAKYVAKLNSESGPSGSRILPWWNLYPQLIEVGLPHRLVARGRCSGVS